MSYPKGYCGIKREILRLLPATTPELSAMLGRSVHVINAHIYDMRKAGRLQPSGRFVKGDDEKRHRCNLWVGVEVT